MLQKKMLKKSIIQNLRLKSRCNNWKDLLKNQHHCIPLQEDWKELGEYNFAMEILETGLTVEEAAKFEQELIKRSYGVNYNTSKW